MPLREIAQWKLWRQQCVWSHRIALALNSTQFFSVRFFFPRNCRRLNNFYWAESPLTLMMTRMTTMTTTTKTIQNGLITLLCSITLLNIVWLFLMFSECDGAIMPSNRISHTNKQYTNRNTSATCLTVCIVSMFDFFKSRLRPIRWQMTGRKNCMPIGIVSINNNKRTIFYQQNGESIGLLRCVIVSSIGQFSGLKFLFWKFRLEIIWVFRQNLELISTWTREWDEAFAAFERECPIEWKEATTCPVALAIKTVCWMSAQFQWNGSYGKRK